MCPKSLRDGRRGGAELNEVGPHSALEASAELQGCVCAVGDGGARGAGGMPQCSDLAAHLPPFCWVGFSGPQKVEGRQVLVTCSVPPQSCSLPYLPEFDLMSHTERKAKIEQPPAMSFQSLESEHSSHTGAGMSAAGASLSHCQKQPLHVPLSKDVCSSSLGFPS